MSRYVQRLRAQYQQAVQDRAQREKDRAETGRNPQTGETFDDRMEEDDVGDVGEKSAKRNPAEQSKKNAWKLRKHPGAIKWVRKLGHLLETQND